MTMVSDPLSSQLPVPLVPSSASTLMAPKK